MKILSSLAVWLTLSVSAYGATLCLTNNSGACASLNITATVLDANTITIANESLIASRIDIIYFDPTPDDLISGITIVSESAGVDFTGGGTPENLPSGNNALPPFESVYRISSVGPGNDNDIDPGQSITVSATNLGTLFAADDGSLRIGLHIQGVAPNGESESVLVTPGGGVPPAEVPEPGSFLLLSSGIALVLLGRSKYKRA